MENESPNRRSTLEYLNYMAGGRSLRFNLTREKLIDSLKTMVWVIPLTVLIWIYAEREQIVYPNLPNVNGVEVNFLSSNPRRIVEPASPNPTVNLKLTGPQEAIDKVKQRLMSTIPHGLSIDTGDMVHGDGQPVSIVERIQNDPIFKLNGVTVLDSQPPEVLVNIDDKKTIEDVPVEIAPTDAANLSARFDPPKVILNGPARLIQRLKDAGQLHVYADLSLVPRSTTPGEQPMQSVPLRLPVIEPHIRIEPMKVNATLTVKASDVPVDVDYIPIVIEAPLEVLRDNDISSTGELSSTGITRLTCPPELVEALKNHTIRPAPKAALVITKDDASLQDTVSKSLRYDLPPGVHVSQADADRKVDFKCTAKPKI
jgi:hypothetical protein